MQKDAATDIFVDRFVDLSGWCGLSCVVVQQNTTVLKRRITFFLFYLIIGLVCLVACLVWLISVSLVECSLLSGLVFGHGCGKVSTTAFWVVYGGLV